MFNNLSEAMDLIEMFTAMRDNVLETYGQEHRHYHNIEHIENIVRSIPDDKYYTRVLIEAAIFHDFVYLPQPHPYGLSEALSVAEYMTYVMYAFVPDIFEKDRKSFEHERLVIEAINATTFHQFHQEHLSEPTKVFLDLDLKILSHPWEEFIAYDDAVAKERGTTEGRVDFLKDLLHKKQIYYVHPEWELAAKENLKKRILMG